MANHVHTHVYFEKLSDAGKAELQKIYGRVREAKPGEHLFTDIFVDGDEFAPTYEEANTRQCSLDYVGPKWCFFEDMYEDSFTTTSAWSWPENGVESLFDMIEVADKDFIATVSYEDEAYNFMGAYVYDKGGCVDGLEDSGEEILEILMNEVDGLSDEWDDEEEEFTDEGWDMYHDNISEVMSNYYSTMINGIIENLDDE